MFKEMPVSIEEIHAVDSNTDGSELQNGSASGRENSTGAVRGCDGELTTYIPTFHAITRYSERVLRDSIDPDELRNNDKVVQRCIRGIRRLAVDAEQVFRRRGNPEEYVLVRRNRALICQGDVVVTVLVSDGDRGFPKNKWRRFVDGGLRGIEFLSERLSHSMAS